MTDMDTTPAVCVDCEVEIPDDGIETCDDCENRRVRGGDDQ